MLSEPTTISSAARLIGETLETHYGIDYKPLFEAIGMDPGRLEISGSRYLWRRMQQLWVAAARATNDPCFGLVVGANIRPTTFHALGFSWLASRTLLESLQRFCRYTHLLSNAPYTIELLQRDDTWIIQGDPAPDADAEASRLSMDALFVAIIRLCKQTRDKNFHPVAVYLRRPAEARIDDYVKAFEAPVYFDAELNGIAFDRELMEQPLPGENLELAIANDRIAEEYIAALEPDNVSTEVRKLLIELLPSGEASQGSIAKQMNRSLSTLQRQLAGEKTNYKEIREHTRKELAAQYVREGRYTLSQIAYLLGFSDQSNFSRAFRRWTGVSPGNYAKH
jgi:AraC-like DNA-binding protein